MAYKTKAKHAVKEVRASLADNNADNTKENLNRAMSVLQKTVARGVLHKNTAARRISRLTRQANRLT
jgi:small subunit ribosomal protein S20